jgi:hypothetical protein
LGLSAGAFARGGDATSEIRRLLQPPAITQLERDLLRCCLLGRYGAAEAWGRISAQGDPSIPASLLPLLGLLGERLTAAGLRMSESLAARLRAAQAIERQRNEALREIAGFILGLPAISLARPLVVGGLASAMLAWHEPMLRHTSRLVLLFSSPRMAIDSARILTAFTDYEIANGGHWIGSGLRLSHRSGMPIVFHGGYCEAPAWGMTYERLVSGGLAGKAAEHDVRLGDGASCLALATLDGLDRQGQSASLLWLADAVLLLRKLSEAERYRYLPPAVMQPLIRRAAEIDPALPATDAIISHADSIRAMAALRGTRAALSSTSGVRRLLWLIRLAPGTLIRKFHARLRPRY